MRFVCETCQTRYIIPDERARGRVLKIRCKKCGNTILVKGEGGDVTPAGASAASSTQPSSPGASSLRLDERTQLVDAAGLQRTRGEATIAARAPLPPAAVDLGSPPQERTEWHVILGGKQLGPVPMSELIEKMLGGYMTGRSYVWRDGIGDWKRAEDVPEIARWLPANSTPSAPATTPSGPTPPRAADRTPAAERPAKEDFQSFFESGAGAEEVEHEDPAVDPFSQIQDAPGFGPAKVQENTRFFITQSGITRSRSPWRITGYAAGFAVLIGVLLVGLSRLGVQVPLVSDMRGEPSRVFSGASGDSHLKEGLLGRRRDSPPSGARAGGAGPRGPSQGAAEQSAQGPLARKQEQHVERLAQDDKQRLAQLYASQNLDGPRLKPSSTADSPVIDRTDAPLTADQVSRTVSRFQSGYTACIDRELKRNPSFQGGKIRIVTTILSSGLVQKAQIQSDDARLQRFVAGSQLGSCLTDQTRRMVFPSFTGDPFDAEIPLVVGASL